MNKTILVAATATLATISFIGCGKKENAPAEPSKQAVEQTAEKAAEQTAEKAAEQTAEQAAEAAAKLKADQKNTCIDNLRQIEGACEQAQLSGVDKPTLDTDEKTGIYGADKYIKTKVNCPTDGAEYKLDDKGNPHCPHEADLEHALPSIEE